MVARRSPKPKVGVQILLGLPVNSLNQPGAMAKWLRQRFAKPLFPGSNPGGASKIPSKN